MKSCPQCQNECADDAIVCPKCGYLFSATQTSGGWGETPPYQNNTSPYRNGNPYDERPKDGFATPSMVLGIIGVVFSCCGIGLIPAVIGLILGIISKARIRKTGLRGNGMALAGIILSAIAIGIVTIALVRVAVIFSNPTSRNEFVQEYNRIIEQYQSSRS